MVYSLPQRKAERWWREIKSCDRDLGLHFVEHCYTLFCEPPLFREIHRKDSMKNTIPLVFAVVLGLLAVFAVSRAMSGQNKNIHGKEVSVLVANGNLRSGDVVAAEHFRVARVPLAYLPKQHILSEQSTSIVGQSLLRDVAVGDYLQWNDIGQSSSLGESVGEGEWTVPVSFANSELVKMLKPGDEIAIMGMFTVSVEREADSPDVRQAKVQENKTVTTVLFPQVRIMGMAGRGGSVLLSLPPAQALTIIAAQKQATLYAALRRPHDDKALSRKSCGMFDSQAFAKMLDGCKEIAVPDQPYNKVGK